MKKYVKIFHKVKIPWFLLFVLLLVNIFEAKVMVRTVQLSADIIDSSKKTIELEPLLRYLTFMAGTVGCAVANAWVGEITYGKIKMRVRNKLFEHILKLPSGYYDRTNPSELVSRVTSDSDSASYYFEVLLTSFGAVYQAVLIFISLIGYNKRLGIYSLLIIPVTCGVAAAYGFMTFRISRILVNSEAVTTGYLFERTASFRIIKAFNARKKEILDGNHMFRIIFRGEMLNQMTIAFIQLGMQIINLITILIAFVFGSRLVNQGLLTIGELVAFYSLSGVVGVQLINLFLNFGTFTATNGSLKNVAMILQMEQEKADGMEMDGTDQDLVFDHVSFRYLERNVLEDVSFVIPKNRVTAIVGTNGAGKSTVVKLVQRMYEPTGGRLLYGDRDAKDYSLRAWRDHFSVVSQNSALISGTIRENLCYGTDRKVSEEELCEAAKACGIYEYICSQENGFDSEISVGSTNLSGGQKQAMAIARALIRDRKILILDEATKNLDAESERLVEKSVMAAMKGRTTIIIAHTPSMVSSADYIVVMRDGQVEATGSREQLLAANDYFKVFMGEKNEI